MAEVPVYGGPRIRQAPVSGARLTTDSPAGAFGGGAVTGVAADAINAEYERMKKRADYGRITAARADAERTLNDLVLEMQGKELDAANPAILDDFRARFAARAKEIEGGLYNAEQLDAFRAATIGAFDDAEARVKRHIDVEQSKAVEINYQALLSQEDKVRMDAFLDDDAFLGSLGRTAESMVDHDIAMGVPAAATNESIAVMRSKSILRRMVLLADANETDRLLEVWHNSKPITSADGTVVKQSVFSPDDLVTAQRLVSGAEKQNEIDSIFDGIAKESDAYVRNLPVAAGNLAGGSTIDVPGVGEVARATRRAFWTEKVDRIPSVQTREAVRARMEAWEAQRDKLEEDQRVNDMNACYDAVKSSGGREVPLGIYVRLPPLARQAVDDYRTATTQKRLGSTGQGLVVDWMYGTSDAVAASKPYSYLLEVFKPNVTDEDFQRNIVPRWAMAKAAKSQAAVELAKSAGEMAFADKDRLMETARTFGIVPSDRDVKDWSREQKQRFHSFAWSVNAAYELNKRGKVSAGKPGGLDDVEKDELMRSVALKYVEPGFSPPTQGENLVAFGLPNDEAQIARMLESSARSQGWRMRADDTEEMNDERLVEFARSRAQAVARLKRSGRYMEAWRLLTKPLGTSITSAYEDNLSADQSRLELRRTGF